MNKQALHPNTQTLLTAWQRMRSDSDDYGDSPKKADHPDLVDCLFVVESREQGNWVFRNAGERMGSLLGRDLADHNYINLWTGHDRNILKALLASIQETQIPGFLKARGETLTGQRIDIEMMLAPLARQSEQTGSIRMLGLYQTLGGAGMLNGRPVWRHRLTAIYPPEVVEETPRLKLVACND